MAEVLEKMIKQRKQELANATRDYANHSTQLAILYHYHYNMLVEANASEKSSVAPSEKDLEVALQLYEKVIALCIHLCNPFVYYDVALNLSVFSRYIFLLFRPSVSKKNP